MLSLDKDSEIKSSIDLAIQRATETFGPIGHGWGVDVKDHGFQKIDDVTIHHWIVITLWYMKNGQKCCFDQTAGSKALYKASTGMVYDEDAKKEWRKFAVLTKDPEAICPEYLRKSWGMDSDFNYLDDEE